MSATARATVLLVAAAAAHGCASRGTPPAERDGAPLVWPSPPARPRIRFVKSVSRPSDLGRGPSLGQRLKRFFTGDVDEGFARPAAIASRGARLYVADPGAPALWILDRESGSATRLSELAQEPLVSPVGVAAGPQGVVFLSDSALARIFALDPAGKAVRSFAQDGLRRPAGIAYDPQRDRLYAADSAAHCVWVFGGDGSSLGAIGKRGTGPGEFNFPTHVAVDRDGGLVVTDSLNFRVQRFGADGAFAAQFGTQGDAGGSFAGPKGIALDGAGHIYVVDALFDAVQIFDGGGRYLLTFGERGPLSGQFWLPGGLSIDSGNQIYVADSHNRRIQIFEYLEAGDG